MTFKQNAILIVLTVLLLNISNSKSSCCDELSVGFVTRVIDGDSIVITFNKQKQCETRLWGIDSPEWNQNFSKESKNLLESLVLYQRVFVESKGVDRYGRCLSVIETVENKVNEKMVQEGGAWVHIYYCNESICKEWKELQKNAINMKKGLWIEIEPVPPWKWKQRHYK